MRVSCWICHRFAAPSFKLILRHMAAVHAHDPNFHTICGIEECPRTYTNFFSFKKHLYRKHRDTLCLMSLPEEQTILDVTVDDYSDDTASPIVTEENERKQSAMFILKAKTIHKVSQLALNGLLDDISTMLTSKIENLQEGIQKFTSSMSKECQESIREMLKVSSPFMGLETQHFQEQYFVDKLGLLKPQEIRVGQSFKRVKKKGITSMKLVWDCTYYVPLLSSLKQYLSTEYILDEVLRGHCRNDGALGDYCDSPAFESHPLFSSNSIALQIFFYYDDAEICNPLGSRSKKHKLALFYYTLGNIKPAHRSTLENIQLIAVTKSSVLQEYGSDHILKPIMEDIKKLEETGFSLCVNGAQYNIKGTIVLVPSDNLASQFLGGYKALNSALRKCRHCMATVDDMKTKFVAEAFKARTRETHQHQCSTLTGASHEHNSIAFGIRHDSILNSSRYFHVTEGLVPDIMHDVLEGSLAYEIKELLKYLVSERIITLSKINECISNFPYCGTDARNKPSTIASNVLSSSDHGLKQSATQTWCLARLLPLMIGEHIDPDDKHWKNFLLQLKIVDYVFAPAITEEIAAYLRVLIQEHHLAFKTLYPMAPIIPKMHYMIHYPKWMAKYGPLIRFWVMRFEGKHNFFKDFAHRIHNFKNVTKSMAEQHQLQSCYMRCSKKSMIEKETTVGSVSSLEVSELSYKSTLLSYTTVSATDAINKLSWINVEGTWYKPKGVVVLEVDHIPTFGIINDIIAINVNDYYLVCEVADTECFDSHFHSYEISQNADPNYIVCRVKELADHYMLSMYHLESFSDLSFISMKYHLIDTV